MNVMENKWICSLCNQHYEEPFPVGGTCEESGCDLLICSNCWSLRGRRFCRRHSTRVRSTGGAQTTGDISDSNELHSEPAAMSAVPQQVNGETGAIKSAHVTTQQAKALEIASIGRFDLNIERFLSLHKTESTGAIFEQLGHSSENNITYLRRLPECNYSVSELRNNFPLNSRSRYRLQAFFSKTFNDIKAIELEISFFARLDRYLTTGYDDNAITLDELTPFIASFITRIQRMEPGDYWVIGLFSPTGWDRSAVSYICGNELTFAHPGISICLIGSEINEIYFSSADHKMAAMVDCFKGITLDEKVSECKALLLEALLIDDHVVLDAFCEMHNFDSKIIKKAYNELIEEERDIERVKVKNLGQIIRTRRKEDLK